MRSLTLARALEAQGARYAFVGPPAMAQMLEVFAPDAASIVADHFVALGNFGAGAAGAFGAFSAALGAGGGVGGAAGTGTWTVGGC